MTNATISSTSDKATVTKILAMRADARKRLGMGACDKCPTCTRPVGQGYSRHNGQEIVEGCVDACHVPHETGVASNRSQWLNRQAARAIRRAELQSLLAL